MQSIAHYNGSTAHQDRTFAYDGYGRLSSQTTPEAGTMTYTYFNNDLVQTVQNQKLTGNTATFGHNSRNLLETVTYNDSGATPGVTYGYDDYGGRTSMTTTGVGSTSYGYNSYHQLNSETVTLTGLGSYTLNYQYTLGGALKQVNYNAGAWSKNVNYDYNSAGSPTSVGTNLIGTDPNATTNIINGLGYTGFGGVKALNFGTNPRLMQTAYDLQRQQMTSLIVRRVSNSGADNYLVSQTYNYKDAANGNKNNGRLMQVSDYMDSSYSASYGYDDYNRLTSATASAYSRTYGYDAWGNLLTLNTGGTTSETGNYTLNYALVGGTNNAPATNRISGNGSDEVGNLTQEGGWAYTYDAANRLKTAGGSGNSYDYDGDGHKVKQMTGGYGPVYYLWSSVLNQPVLELTSGGVYRAYVYGPSGGLLALQSSDANFYWVHSDHLGSGRKLSDASGAMVYRGEYDPHGQTMLEVAPGGSFLNSKKYTGYERNWATNLDDANARTYHHNRARFMQPDPLGAGAADATNPQSLNRYSYVQNDPVNFIDPSGLNAENPRQCYLRIDWTLWDDGHITINNVSLFCTGGGGSGGGTGGSVGGGGGQQGRSDSACSRFVNWIVSQANSAAGSYALGITLLKQAYDISKQVNAGKQFAFDGFKEELTGGASDAKGQKWDLWESLSDTTKYGSILNPRLKESPRVNFVR